jgi:two-component system, LytTR family, sensor kinase
MTLSKYKKQIITSLHLLFWILSINGWYLVFNPGVEFSTVINNIEDYMSLMLPLNIIFCLYCLLPFVWLIKTSRKWLKISLTVLFAVPLIVLFFSYLRPDSHQDEISLFQDYFISGFMYSVVFHLWIATAVYTNLKVLIGKYLKAGRFGIYLSSVLFLMLLAAIGNYAIFNFCIDLLFPNFYFISYFNLPELILITGLYLFFTTVIFLIWQYANMLIANRDKARNELSALKAQINPHFLFNNLNTIYSMASKNDHRTADVVLKLSDFLRYVLYDTSSDTIPLEKEVEIIRTYVSLQKERVHPDITQIDLTTEGNFKGVEIAPLLMLPLAENCFKHGKGKNGGNIQIYIGFDGQKLLFRTENKIALREKASAGENGGIGISNVEKRLQLIYPGQHSLEYGDKAGVFCLEMKIELS